jgi:hypothetical protein
MKEEKGPEFSFLSVNFLISFMMELELPHGLHMVQGPKCERKKKKKKEGKSLFK